MLRFTIRLFNATYPLHSFSLKIGWLHYAVPAFTDVAASGQGNQTAKVGKPLYFA